MDFLNEFSKRFSNVARQVSEKSKENPELARLNDSVRAAKAELEQLYARYGKACYAVREGQGDKEMLDALAVRIRAAKLALEELTDQREAAYEQKRCANCGAVHPAQARYCSMCGKRLPEEAPKPEPLPEGEYCPNCGARREGDDAVCPVCGADLSPLPPEPTPEPERPAAPDVEEPTAEEEGEE